MTLVLFFFTSLYAESAAMCSLQFATITACCSFAQLLQKLNIKKVKKKP